MKPKFIPPMLVILISVACAPPVMLDCFDSKDSRTTAAMSQAEYKTLPLASDVAFGRLTEALLNMKCMITASDSSNGILSFKQVVQYEHQGWRTVKEGTLRITGHGSTVQCHLFLKGQPTRVGDSQLAPAEYDKFFKEIISSIKSITSA